MDPLSTVLSILKPRNYLAAGLEAGGEWSIQFPGQQGTIKTGAVLTGNCWLAVDGDVAPVQLQTGDCFLLPSGRPFRLASDLTLPSVAPGPIFAGPRKGNVACVNGGGEFSIVSNRFGLSGNYAGLLLRMLPPIVQIRDKPGQTELRWSIDRMMTELRDPQPGGFLIIEHLAQLMLIQALRMHLHQGSATGVGWLFALADPQISRALNAMHNEPAHRWTLHNLATHAAMSRSTFALKFKTVVGTSPMDYLVNWRMALAGDRLQNSKDPISVIAPSLGYESEAAFSTAFKRVMGCAPRQYSQRNR